MESAIVTRGLTKRYHSVTALHDLDLSVPTGSIFALLGPNGAGKTTTIRLLLSLLRPTRGEVTILGRSSLTEGEAIRARVGYVAEQPFLYDYHSVADAIAFHRAFYHKWDEAALKACLSGFGLSLRQRVRGLSKGQRTQLSLALALASRPEVLILDEPTAGLDPIARRAFEAVVIDHAVAEGQTVLLSSHALADVERLVDHVAVLVEGRLVLQEPLDDLKANHRKVRAVFAGEPPTDLLRHPSVRETVREGRGILFSLWQDAPSFLAALDAAAPLAYDVIDLSLEDIFVEYAGGARRAARPD